MTEGVEVRNSNPEEAKAILEADQRKRVEACILAVKVAVEKYNCNIIADVRLFGAQIQSSVTIVAK